MNNEQITPGQIKELWGGVFDGKVEFGEDFVGDLIVYLRTSWNEEDGEWNIGNPIKLDLNNLFKYAVPKLINDGYTIYIETTIADEIWYCWQFEKGDDEWHYSWTDPAEALALAILEVIHGQ